MQREEVQWKITKLKLTGLYIYYMSKRLLKWSDEQLFTMSIQAMAMLEQIKLQFIVQT